MKRKKLFLHINKYEYKYEYKRVISINLNTFYTFSDVRKNTAVFLIPWTWMYAMKQKKGLQKKSLGSKYEGEERIEQKGQLP